MNLFEAKAAAEWHKQRECPQEDTRKRIIDCTFEGPPLDPSKIDVYHLPPGTIPPRIFRCRGCGWSVTEKR